MSKPRKKSKVAAIAIGANTAGAVAVAAVCNPAFSRKRQAQNHSATPKASA
jgi:hypothetical protein